MHPCAIPNPNPETQQICDYFMATDQITPVFAAHLLLIFWIGFIVVGLIGHYVYRFFHRCPWDGGEAFRRGYHLCDNPWNESAFPDMYMNWLHWWCDEYTDQLMSEKQCTETQPTDNNA